MTGNVSWRELYESAMLELDPARLQSRIDLAQLAIRQAMKDLTGNRQGDAVEEFAALSDALANLRTLQRLESRTISADGEKFSPAEGGSHETRVPKNSSENPAQAPAGYDRAAS
jgi:hypothetical protein